ncbi:MAG: endonuclease/exonuclease/phosphatase family protein [Deltaproteobacteria bacterium]|nr:endonuclease/exonuclease/phosphatase family protein [Deltaproteobacteria bacterium]
MVRDRRRLDVLVACALAACTDVNDGPPPVWTPWDQLEGEFRPELVQVEPAPAPPERLRVVSYNVLEGIDVDEDAAFFAGHADLASADVIALQEVRRRAGAPAADAADFAQRLGMGYAFLPAYVQDGDLEGVALVSRFPLRDVQILRLRDEGAGDLEMAARVALRATIDTARGPIRIVNVHLDVRLNVPERVLQLRPAVIDLPSPAAVLGDFNTNDYVWFAERIPIRPLDAVASTSQADALDEYMRAIGFATPTAYFGDTWHGSPEDQRLDAVFTRGLRSSSGGVERRLHTSDHWPIWLDVRIPAP